jgi:hypothetical protein
MPATPDLPSRFIAASVLAAAVGVAALVPVWWRRRRSPPDPACHLAVAWTTGLALLVPPLLVAGLWHLPLTAATLAAAALLLAALLSAARRRSGVAAWLPLLTPLAEPAATGGWERLLRRASWAVLAAALGVAAWKVAAMPLWSWDHYAIWGVKAERMLLGGRLDLSFLHTRAMVDSRPDYPLGLPLAWRYLALGARPGAAGYKLLHGVFALALVVVLRRGLAGLSGSTPLANALTAWAVAMPLFWDTALVGVAEVPLALVATVAAVLLAVGRGEDARWGAGIALGFLPWIKAEGLVLALLLGALGLGAGAGEEETPAWRRRLPVALPALVGIALALWIGTTQLAPAVGFFSGDPLARAAERLPRGGEILGWMGRMLTAPDALLFWPLFALAALVAALRRRALALRLAGVVAVQLALYMGVTFFVYLPPRMHLDASFGRITAALVPLGMLALGAALGPKEAEPVG